MSPNSSPITPKAKPAEAAYAPSPPSPMEDTLDSMERSKARNGKKSPQDQARNLTPTRAPSILPPRSSFENSACAAPALPLPPTTRAILTANQASASSVYIFPDGSVVRSSAGFRAGTVPGNYRSRFDHNMVYRVPGSSLRSFCQPYHVPTSPLPELVAASHPARSVILTPAPAVAPSRMVTPPPMPAPVTASSRHIPAVKPPPGTPHRLVLLGPLRMIRSQCVAKRDILHPILIWIDHFMGDELQMPVCTDTMISNIVYAVNIPMVDEHWLDWNRVLAVFPRAAAWQQAMTLDEPFDQITATHPTVNIFLEGEPLESLLADMAQQYNLGMQYNLDRPWDEPGQTEWQVPLGREAYARS